MPTVDGNIEVKTKKKKVKTVPAKLGTVITEQEFNTLDNMLRSKDQGDHRMAQAILNQCDIQKSIYWIWKLAKHSSSNMVYLRTKASREFQVSAKLFEIAWMKPTDFAIHLHKKGWLTIEIFARLKPGILDELTQRNKGKNLYDMHATLKDELKQYDPEEADTVISLPKTNESIT